MVGNFFQVSLLKKQYVVEIRCKSMQYLNNKLIGDYKDTFADSTPSELNRELQGAKSYNENRANPDKLKELGLTYEEVLDVADNGVMGYIEIPKISVSLIIYHTIEENVLQKGIGHVPESHLPVGGESTHSILTGHTGLPSAKLRTAFLRDTLVFHLQNYLQISIT